MKEKKNTSFIRWVILSIFVLLFLYGFEYELTFFYYEQAKIKDYILALASLGLLLIYIIPLVYALFWLGKKLRVDKRLVVVSLLFGMFIPGFMAGIANVTGETLLEVIISKKFSETWGLAFTAPFNEEILKIIVVFASLYLLRKKSLSDFFVSGCAVGLGFQIMEDISYVGSDGLPDMNNLVPLVLSRISGAWSSHWTYTSLFALGFYFILNRKKISTGLSLIFFVLLNHFLWDSPYGEWEFVPAVLGATMILCLIYVGKKYIIGEFDKKGDKMKNIGLLVAVEVEAVTSKYKYQLKHEFRKGFDVYILERGDYRLHFVHSNVGLIRAAAAVQMLIDIYDIDFLINFGVVGALREDLNVADTCFVEKIVHYDMDTSAIDNIEVGRYLEYPDFYLPTSSEILKKVKELYPEIPVLIGACADKFVHKDEDKRALNEKYGADICDMESAAVVLISDNNNIPNLVIKTVSDSLTGGANEYEKRMREASDMCIDIVEKVLESNLI